MTNIMAKKTVRFHENESGGSPMQNVSQRLPPSCSAHLDSVLPSSPSFFPSRGCKRTPGSVLTKGGAGPDGMYPMPAHWNRDGWRTSESLNTGGVGPSFTSPSNQLQSRKVANRGDGDGGTDAGHRSGRALIESVWANGMIANSPLLSTIAQPTLELTCRGHRGTVTGVCFQPPGYLGSTPTRRLGREVNHGIEPPNVISSGSDGAVTLWEPKISHSSYRNTTHRSPVLCCDASPRGGAVASGGHNGYAQLWIPNLRRNATTYPASWSVPAGSMGDDDYYQWKAHSGGSTRAVAFARDGSDMVYTGGDDKAVKCWDLNYLHGTNGRRRGEKLGRGGLRGLDGEVCGSRPESSHGRCLSGNRFIGSFSTPSTSRLAGIVGHTNWIRTIAVQDARTHSSYFHLLASGGDDQCAFLWDTRTYQCVDVLREAASSVYALSFHPSGYALATGDAAGAIHIYDLRRVKGGRVASLRKEEGKERTRRENALITSSSEGGYHQLIQRYGQAHSGGVNEVQFTPDGNWMISVGDDGFIHIWDVVEGHLYCAVQAHQGAVKACRISADGKYFATGGVDRLTLVWQLQLPLHHNSEEDEVVVHWTDKEETASIAEDADPGMPYFDPAYDGGALVEMDGEVDERKAPDPIRNGKNRVKEDMCGHEEEIKGRTMKKSVGPVPRQNPPLEDSPIPIRITPGDVSRGAEGKKCKPPRTSFPPSEIQKRMEMHAAVPTFKASVFSEQQINTEDDHEEEDDKLTHSHGDDEQYRFRRSEERFESGVVPQCSSARNARIDTSRSAPLESMPPSLSDGGALERVNPYSTTHKVVLPMEIEQLRKTQSQMMKEIENLRLAIENLTNQATRSKT